MSLLQSHLKSRLETMDSNIINSKRKLICNKEKMKANPI